LIPPIFEVVFVSFDGLILSEESSPFCDFLTQPKEQPFIPCVWDMDIFLVSDAAKLSRDEWQK